MSLSLFYRWVELFLILLLVIASASACVNGGQKNATLESVEPSLNLLSVKAFWPEAQTMAQEEWQADAYVSQVSVDVLLATKSLPEALSSPGVNFYFQALSEDLVTFVVHCSNEGCSFFMVEHDPERRLAHCRPIALNEFALDSRDAIDIGMQQGGEDYLLLESTNVVLKLYRGLPSCNGPVRWYVSFLDLSTQTGLDVIIDAVTGDVAEIRE